MKILKFKNKQKFKYNKKVIIKDLTLLLSVGIHKFEKIKKQNVRFNIEITTDPNLKPDVKTIVNYESIINDIKKLTEKTHFELLESLSETIFDETNKSCVLQVTALRREIDKMSTSLKKYGLISISRPGAVAMTRGSEVFK